MKKNFFSIGFACLMLIIGFSSCQAIAGIFKAGVWVGVLLVVGIIALIIFLVSRSGGSK